MKQTGFKDVHHSSGLILVSPSEDILLTWVWGCPPLSALGHHLRCRQLRCWQWDWHKSHAWCEIVPWDLAAEHWEQRGAVVLCGSTGRLWSVYYCSGWVRRFRCGASVPLKMLSSLLLCTNEEIRKGVPRHQGVMKLLLCPGKALLGFSVTATFSPCECSTLRKLLSLDRLREIIQSNFPWEVRESRESQGFLVFWKCLETS